jgi:hypothetical protein
MLPFMNVNGFCAWSAASAGPSNFTSRTPDRVFVVSASSDALHSTAEFGPEAAVRSPAKPPFGDAVLRDPSNPSHMRQEFMTDGIHPNNAGAQAMADAINLLLCSGSRIANCD